MTVFTFRTEPNGPVALTVECESESAAISVANEKLVWGKLNCFYGWMGTSPDFYATYGVWD